MVGEVHCLAAGSALLAVEFLDFGLVAVSADEQGAAMGAERGHAAQGDDADQARRQRPGCIPSWCTASYQYPQ